MRTTIALFLMMLALVAAQGCSATLPTRRRCGTLWSLLWMPLRRSCRRTDLPMRPHIQSVCRLTWRPILRSLAVRPRCWTDGAESSSAPTSTAQPTVAQAMTSLLPLTTSKSRIGSLHPWLQMQVYGQPPTSTRAAVKSG